MTTPVIDEPLSERALALVIRCRIMAGQRPFDAVTDVLGVERFDAMRKILHKAVEDSIARKRRRTPR